MNTDAGRCYKVTGKCLKRKSGFTLFASSQLAAAYDPKLEDVLGNCFRQGPLEGPIALLLPGGHGSGGNRRGGVLIEAERFNRGNLTVDNGEYGYGTGIGVVLSLKAPAHAEYALDHLAGGAYALWVRYAAAESRPLTLVANRRMVRHQIAGEATGGWTPAMQVWRRAGVLWLNSGRNTIRLEREGVFPHLDKLLLLPSGEPREPQ